MHEYCHVSAELSNSTDEFSDDSANNVCTILLDKLHLDLQTVLHGSRQNQSLDFAQIPFDQNVDHNTGIDVEVLQESSMTNR
ncbi:hypothetical protein M8J75_009371 [Diaphorina citri]|nr:hypothetical protein M8J75_009371 [Diaphorina citri]